MAWISLCATRYHLRDILKHNFNDEDYQETRLEVVDAADGRDALLVGDDYYIQQEIQRAEVLLEDYQGSKHSPNASVMSQVFSLAVIASLGKKDYSDLFELIAGAKSYKTPWEKSLQLIAQRIVGWEKLPTKKYAKRGHIVREAQWFRIVTEAQTGYAFNLSVTPDHPGWRFLCSYVLPLAFLLSQGMKDVDRNTYLRQLLVWGGPDPDPKTEVLYERNSKIPDAGVEVIRSDRKTWRGFDAVIKKDDEFHAYYYLGSNWRTPLSFGEGNNSLIFLEHSELDWLLVEDAVSEVNWRQIDAAKKQGNFDYVIVYDSSVTKVLDDTLENASKHYGVKIEAKDITEV